MNRRGFLQSILVAAAAPAIVRPASLMKIVRPTERIILPNPLAWSGAVREMRAYDINRDLFTYRWDVAGMVGGAFSQFTVAMEDPPAAPLLVSRGDDAQAISWGRDPKPQPREELREKALAALRERVRESGMVIIRDRLELPRGLDDARFL